MATVERRTVIPEGWPIYVAFGLFPVWWLLGLGSFIWPLLTIPLLLRYFWARGFSVPGGFGLYLLFLIWVIGSATQVDGAKDLAILAFRFSLYLSAGILCVAVFNASPRRVTDARVLASIVVLWATVVIGGFLGMLFPTASITSLAQLALPGALAGNAWIQDLTSIRFAQVQDFLGYSVSRPSAPFAYTNEWGSALALLTPLVVAFLLSPKSKGWRGPVMILLLASVVPAVMSVNRGLWLSLGVGLIYALVRLAMRGRGALLLAALVVLFVAGGVVWVTDLREIVADRLETGHSNVGRIRLAEEALASASDSPLLGHGGPQAADRGPRIGTHGFVWLLIVSHGIPSALLFVAWLLHSLFRAPSGPSTSAAFWAKVVLFIAVVQLPYYEILPVQLQIVAVAAGLAWRGSVGERVALAAPRPRSGSLQPVPQ